MQINTFLANSEASGVLWRPDRIDDAAGSHVAAQSAFLRVFAFLSAHLQAR
jgi:hypothetical protein